MVKRQHERAMLDARLWLCPALLAFAAALISPAFPRETHPEPGPPFPETGRH